MGCEEELGGDEKRETTFLGEALLKRYEQVLDDDGFVVGFEPVDAVGIKSFFDEWGFVVVGNVIPDELCNQGVTEFWDSAARWGAAPDAPEKWDDFWSIQRFGRLGIIGITGEVKRRALLEMRQHPNLHKVFTSIFGQEELWVDHDRMGVLRPTKNIPIKQVDGSTSPIDRSDWKTITGWLHVDCNPVSGQTDIGSFARDFDGPVELDFINNTYVQGFIALTDAREEDGGFHCVPGSKVLLDLYRSTGRFGSGNIQIGKPKHPIWRYVRRVPVRKGSVVVWNSLTLHGNYPNDSDQFRMVHYCRMLPLDRGYLPLGYYDPSFPLTPLGKRLFGEEPWPSKTTK
jgi:hypothetical protein